MFTLAEDSARSGDKAMLAGRYKEANQHLQKAYSIYQQLPIEVVAGQLRNVLLTQATLYQKMGLHKLALEKASELSNHSPHDFQVSMFFWGFFLGFWI